MTDCMSGIKVKSVTPHLELSILVHEAGSTCIGNNITLTCKYISVSLS